MILKTTSNTSKIPRIFGAFGIEALNIVTFFPLKIN